ncbi:MAG: protein kinase, partial [Acidobacteriota bacterium]
VGSVNFMCPEQLEAEEVDHRTDVFSFGVMLYELAVGHHPFVGKSPSSTIGNILKEDPTSLARWNRQLPADLDRVIRKCVRKQRRERYQSVRELLVDVENIRRDLTSPVAVATVTSDSELALSRGMARGLLVFAQCGYLALYIAALYYLEDLERALERILLLPVPLILPLVLIAAMCGIAVRLYLLSAIGLDHPATGVKFEKLFPFVVVLDGLWAASPLLMARSFGIGLALACVAALAYLPFSQRTLVRRAYRVTGDHRSEA